MTTIAVRKIAQLHDEAQNLWFDAYEAPGIEGTPITAEVPREDQAPATVRRHLLSKGAVLPPPDEHRDALAAVIASPAPVVRRAARTGWRSEGALFVTHLHVAGEVAGVVVIPPAGVVAGAAGQLDARGDLDGWKELAALGEHSTAITVALCAAFAAPLLAPLRRPSFALVLVGPSRSGKSTAQLLAASALGFGDETHLPSLNATRAGLLAAALAFNDHMLPINEVGTAPGPKREIYVAVRDATYALMSGQDVLRHPSYTGGGATPGTFQVVVLLSSEHSPDAWAARNGEVRDEGETARLIGLPVLATGKATIFDRPPAGLENDAVAGWEEAQFQRIREGLPHQHGVAFRAFVESLVANSDAARDAQRLVARHEERVGHPSMSPVARDIVAKFGVLYAGGMMAVRAGVLPLSKLTVGRAVRRACRAALAALPDHDAELRADLAALKERLGSGGLIDADSCTRKQLRLMREADGFHRPMEEGKGGGEEFVVRAEVFADWFSTPLRARRVLEWLDDEGLLDHTRGRSNGRSNEWAQKQVKWPDGTRPRSFCLILPAGLATFDRVRG